MTMLDEVMQNFESQTPEERRRGFDAIALAFISFFVLTTGCATDDPELGLIMEVCGRAGSRICPRGQIQ
jgi:hypothetical protein